MARYASTIPYGTAPGQWIDLGAQAIVLLPGPPREMGPMLDGLVAGALGARAGDQRTYSRGLKVAGRSESSVEATLQPLYATWRAAAPAARGDDPRGARAHRTAPVRAHGRRRDCRGDVVAGDRRRGSGTRAVGLHDHRRIAGGTRGSAAPRRGLARRGGRVLHRRHAGRAPDRRARQFGMGRRRRDHVQQRVEDGPGRRAGGTHRRARRRERARGAGPGGRRSRPVRHAGGHRHHRHRRPGRRHRRQAGRHGLHRACTRRPSSRAGMRASSAIVPSCASSRSRLRSTCCGSRSRATTRWGCAR